MYHSNQINPKVSSYLIFNSFSSKEDFNIDEQKLKDSINKSCSCTSEYLKKIINFEDIYFSGKALLRLYCCSIIFNLLSDKLILFIIMNLIIFYSPIENKSEHFLFKLKMAIKQTFEGIIGLIITFIPKYEPPKEKEKQL